MIPVVQCGLASPVDIRIGLASALLGGKKECLKAKIKTMPSTSAAVAPKGGVPVVKTTQRSYKNVVASPAETSTAPQQRNGDARLGGNGWTAAPSPFVAAEASPPAQAAGSVADGQTNQQQNVQQQAMSARMVALQEHMDKQTADMAQRQITFDTDMAAMDTIIRGLGDRLSDMDKNINSLKNSMETQFVQLCALIKGNKRQGGGDDSLRKSPSPVRTATRSRSRSKGRSDKGKSDDEGEDDDDSVDEAAVKTSKRVKSLIGKKKTIRSGSL